MRVAAIVVLLAGTTALWAESAAGVQWRMPPGWVTEATRPMRAATYDVPGGAQCVVYFFGANQGGTVQANLTRWKSQMLGPHREEAPAKVETRNIHGLRVTTIDVSGTYTGMGGPMAATPAQPAPGYRLMGAVVEAPGGNLFIKFAAPAAVAAKSAHDFELLLGSFAPAPR